MLSSTSAIWAPRWSSTTTRSASKCAPRYRAEPRSCGPRGAPTITISVCSLFRTACRLPGVTSGCITWPGRWARWPSSPKSAPGWQRAARWLARATTASPGRSQPGGRVWRIDRVEKHASAEFCRRKMADGAASPQYGGQVQVQMGGGPVPAVGRPLVDPQHIWVRLPEQEFQPGQAVDEDRAEFSAQRPPGFREIGDMVMGR